MSTSDRETEGGEPLTLADFHDVRTANDIAGGAGGDERRREPRFASDKIVAFRPCRPDDARGFRPARVLDCSVHGLGLFVDEPMRAGEQFLVKFKLERLILAQYDVRHCRPVAGRYIVGAALTGFIGGETEPDGEAVLRALLLKAGRPWQAK
jgi:hypothetical protein